MRWRIRSNKPVTSLPYGGIDIVRFVIWR